MNISQNSFHQLKVEGGESMHKLTNIVNTKRQVQSCESEILKLSNYAAIEVRVWKGELPSGVSLGLAIISVERGLQFLILARSRSSAAYFFWLSKSPPENL